MRLAPWRIFRTWTCLLCGECCRKYFVPLSKKEAFRIRWKYGRETVVRKNGKFYLAKINGECIFLKNNTCSIQEDKPLACKLWPFYIYEKPKRDKDKQLAKFTFGSKVFYVYVDQFCKGLNTGLTPIEFAVKEAIQIYLRERKTQTYTTSPFIPTEKQKIPIIRALNQIVARPILQNPIHRISKQNLYNLSRFTQTKVNRPPMETQHDQAKIVILRSKILEHEYCDI